MNDMKAATHRFAYSPSRLEDLCCELEALRALSRRDMRLRTDIPLVKTGSIVILNY